MARRGAHLDAEMIGALDDLALHVLVPDSSAVNAAVRARVAGERASTRPAGLRSPRVRTRVLVAAAVIVVVVGAVLTLSSSTRDAVADFFGLGGVEIERQDTPARGQTDGTSSLGLRVGLDEARRRVDFDVALPARHGLGVPDAAYVGDVPAGGRITLAFAPRPGLPATGTPGVGLLLTEYRAGISEPVLRKTVAAATEFEQVTVDGAPGYWFSGQPHVVTLADVRGRFFEDRARIVGNTLLWQRGAVTYRIESALSRGETIRIAESLTS